MQAKIEQSLKRQKQGLVLLRTLLQEEFSVLRGHDPKKISSLEFSIQELIRQLVDEKEALKSLLQQIGCISIKDYILELSDGEKAKIENLLGSLEENEQKCVVQAAKNAELAQALAEQTTKLTKFLYERLLPRNKDTYSARGRWQQKTARATLLRGTL
ncbi:flagellar export chaperone FlgN [Desulfohalobiaceae bacterium Ax17]|uniref:flagellar export chaperone FlgN n=1 Tax=Desulfovulcanus ferrireducens TaxID=2831190 RepID=UPI00207BB92E|nr:flagellar export chaperone FlgN [Desulfovulcanus ferrireducens]MBT8763789.1 flagellar export chaperone FlgN [Desulfovulcanus ferrireducens]